jgi:hypothetical protein
LFDVVLELLKVWIRFNYSLLSDKDKWDK